VIEIRDIGHHFRSFDGAESPLWVLQRVNLSVQDATFVSFLGPSGCGKTTLLRIIDGLVAPQEGRVVIDGETVRAPAADRAMVFQEFNLLPWRTALGNIEFGLQIQGVGRDDRKRRAIAALKLVGLEGFSDYYPHQLSGGMKQRVGLARALCTAPRYLLMDEPFGALDPQIRELMQIELMKLWETDRKTVIFVTHSVEEAIFLSDRVVVFSARPGTILEVVEINLPRPRWADEDEIKQSDGFLRHRQHIWKVLKREIQRATSAEAAASPLRNLTLRRVGS
jgi:NitT/TauT family transport system ATP-binding protein